jgi:hypothetical protein
MVKNETRRYHKLACRPTSNSSFSDEHIELQRLHKLVKANLLDFSPEFIRLRQVELAEGRSSIPEFKNMIKDIETALLNKLNAGSNKKFMEVPWIILKKENVINWPQGVPLQNLSHHTKEHLQLLHKLRFIIYFRKEFFKKDT